MGEPAEKEEAQAAEATEATESTEAQTTEGAEEQSPEKRAEIRLIQPFILATVDTIQKQCSCTVKVGSPFKKGFGTESKKEFLAILGVMSQDASGLVAICFEKKPFLGMMGKMFGEEYDEITPDLKDGLKEMVNIIFGRVKKELGGMGILAQRLIPTFVEGADMNLSYLCVGHSVVVPFEADFGTFHLEISMEENSL